MIRIAGPLVCKDCGNWNLVPSRPTPFRSVVRWMGLRRYRCTDCGRWVWRVGYRHPPAPQGKRRAKPADSAGPAVDTDTPPPSDTRSH